MALNDSHIDFIRTDLTKRGLVSDELTDELVDHFCETVTEKVANGQRFFESYLEALDSFGAERTIHQVQEENFRIKQQPKNMLKNYIVIAWRNIKKQKIYSFINVFGLAIGIAASLLIAIYIVNELQYDNFHEKKDRIYRVISDIRFGDNDFHFAVAPAPLGLTLANDFPEVESTVRFRSQGSFLVKPVGTAENIKVNQLVYSDSSFFSVFSIPLLYGNEKEVLKGMNKAAVSRTTAENLFGETDVVGKQILLDGTKQVQISGVYEDMPDNSHFKIDIMVSMESLQESVNGIWLSNNFYTYVLLREGASPEVLESKFPEMIVKYIGPQVKQFTGQSLEQAMNNGSKIEYNLQPLTDVYLHSDFTFDIGEMGDIQIIYIFSAVALLIIILACINFMNLSTARSTTRAKEVGIRKVLGSVRPHLIRQFLSESILITGISFILALGLASILMPFFNQIAQKDLSIPYKEPLFYLISLAVILMVGVGAGLYPSIFLSAFKPVQVLKGKVLNSRSGAPIRSALVVFQFVITIVLLLGTAAVYKQLNFIQSKKLGFQKEQVLLVRDAYMLDNDIDAYRNQLLNAASITNATVSGYLPIEKSNRADMSFWEMGNAVVEDNMVNAQIWQVDHRYIPTLDMNVVDGRNFSPEYPGDSTAIVVNEAVVRAFNLEKPIGTRLQTFVYDPETGETKSDEFNTYTIIGVIEDFHFNTMHKAISPLILSLGTNAGYMAVRFNSSDTEEVIQLAQNEWNDLNPGAPFSYTFMSDEFSTMYRTEQRLGRIFSIFAGLAILIGCLGLFGLATYLTEQRVKEIGIRKVLGASNNKIILLLSQDFGKLILIAIFISVPLAWLMIREWLVSFEYRTKIGWEVYVIVAFIAIFIAAVSILYQSIKAALSNPAETIRSE